MKELSIEEKARRYDEILARAKGANLPYYKEDIMSKVKEFVDYLIPELAESKDERIRKWLICTLKSLNSTAVQIDGAYEMMLPAITWLEKQGEQKMKTPEESLGIDSDTYNKIVDECVYGEQKPTDDIERKYNPCYNMSFEDAQEYISNRGFDIPWTDCDVFVDFKYVTQTVANILRWADDNPRQKPADKVEPKFKVRYAGSEYNVFETKDIAGVTFYGIEDEPNHLDYVKAENCEIISGYGIKKNRHPYPIKPAVFSEQNPAWSEDDEAMLNDIISDAEQGEDLDDVQINWLKSLKERYT